MGAGSGVALRGVAFFVRLIQFCCAAIVLAIFSYFLATLNNHNLPIATWLRAVEGISGAAVVYTIVTLLLVCCAAGRSFPSVIMTIFDLAFLAAFIYVAYENRGGASTCNGNVDTPYGSGNADTNVGDNGNGGFTSLPNLRAACKMESACLAVSIVAIFFFVFSLILTHALLRHHRKEKRIGPSPANDYTEGYGAPRKRFGIFSRKSTVRTTASQNPNALPEHTTPADIRTSYATEQTRVGSSGGYGNLGNGADKHENPWANGGDHVPMANYPNANSGYRYENNGGVFR